MRDLSVEVQKDIRQYLQLNLNLPQLPVGILRRSWAEGVSEPVQRFMGRVAQQGGSLFHVEMVIETKASAKAPDLANYANVRLFVVFVASRILRR